MTAALEPIFRVDLPAPVPPRFSLVKAAETLAAGTGLGTSDTPWWEMGGTVWAYPPRNAIAWTGDPDSGSVVAKPDPEADRVWEVAAFEVVATFECAMRGVDDEGEFLQRAQAAFAAYEPFAVERQFWLGGDDGDANVLMPHLDGDGLSDFDTLTTLNAGTAVKPMLGVAMLEQAIADSDAAMGVIHMRPGLATLLGNQFLRASGGSVSTAIMGTTVILGNGYPGTGRDALAITAQNEWAFATGPVWINRGEVRALEQATYDSNDWRVTLERGYQVIYDPAVHVAVKIDKAL